MRVNFLRLIQVFSENRRLRAELLVETGRRKHAEAQLNALRATAAASPCTERSVAQLAASIVHEINQPLSAILTNAQTCVRWLSRAQPDVPQAMQAALRTTRDTKRVVELVQGLRTLASRSRSPMAAVDLDDAIEEVVLRLRAELEHSCIRLDLQLCLDGTVYGNRILLQQVVTNLICNAIEAMTGVMNRPRCLVVVTRNDTEGMAVVSVEDTGVGFDPGHAQRLFAPAFTTKAHGMGIGLSISRAIVDAHGGQLAATSCEGSGAVFSFTVPLWRGCASAGRATTPQSKRAGRIETMDRA